MKHTFLDYSSKRYKFFYTKKTVKKKMNWWIKKSKTYFAQFFNIVDGEDRRLDL